MYVLHGLKQTLDSSNKINLIHYSWYQSLGFSILVIQRLWVQRFFHKLFWRLAMQITVTMEQVHEVTGLTPVHVRFSICFSGANSGANYSSLFSVETCRILFHLYHEPISNSRRIYACLNVSLNLCLEKLHFRWPYRVICKQRQELQMICF